MQARTRVLLPALILTLIALRPAPAHAQSAVPGPCVPGELPSGALSLICVPAAGWNGDLVVFAHGYVPTGAPLGFYNLTVGGVQLPILVQSFGFAFATTSYRQNGLAVLEGMEDIQELITAFNRPPRVASRTFITGASEGGLVATLLAERAPHLFTRGLAACGPVGSFRGQINYVGDFRVLFDYFFPDVLPGSAVDIPADLILNWNSTYLPAVQRAIRSNPARAVELMRTANAAYDPAIPESLVQTAGNVLWYSVFGTIDATTKLGGNPYGNRTRLYLGSSNDLRLNFRVDRFSASPVAVAAMKEYETTGALGIPLVTLHTTADEVVPFVHEPVYAAKVFLTGHTGLTPLPVARYGHCSFTAQEILGAFALMVR
jgi:pimeloyl-ACP methyl ester carboxylesterase